MKNTSRFLYFFLNSFRHPRWDTGISPPELMDFIKSNTPGRAIDLGCGTGTNVLTLAQHGWDVTGVDFIANNIYQSRRKALSAGLNQRIHLYRDSVARLEGIHGLYNLVLDIGCYQGLSDKDREHYQKRVVEILAPGGTLLMYGMINQSGMDFGLTTEDLTTFQMYLRLQFRLDSTDHEHQATWWHFVYS
jgi:cyclopropane fatty-acyl-phospholipid synthase-like methyltransferase